MIAIVFNFAKITHSILDLQLHTEIQSFLCVGISFLSLPFQSFLEISLFEFKFSQHFSLFDWLAGNVIQNFSWFALGLHSTSLLFGDLHHLITLSHWPFVYNYMYYCLSDFVFFIGLISQFCCVPIEWKINWNWNWMINLSYLFVSVVHLYPQYEIQILYGSDAIPYTVAFPSKIWSSSPRICPSLILLSSL